MELLVSIALWDNSYVFLQMDEFEDGFCFFLVNDFKDRRCQNNILENYNRQIRTKRFSQKKKTEQNG